MGVLSLLSKHLMANLERRRNKFYVVKEIPPSLRKLAGKKRWVKSTQTGDIAHANRRKPALLAEYQREMDALRKEHGLKHDPFIERAKQLGEHARANPEDAESRYSETGTELIGTREAAHMLAEDALRGDEDRAEIAGRVLRIASGELPLASALDDFLGDKKITEATQARYRRAIERFLHWSKATFAGDVTTAAANRYVRTQLQKNYTKHQTISAEITALGSFWRWLRKAALATDNPWLDQRPERDKRGSDEDPWTPFTDAELGKILSLAPEGDPVGDITRIGALSGMRREEIVSLCIVEDVDGLLCFRIGKRKGKTANAPRDIPVHSDLKAIVEKRRDERGHLHWGTGAKRAGDALGKRFSRVVRKDAKIADETKVFHSLRKWHATALERGGVEPWTIETLQGRTRGTMGLNRYSKGATVAQLKEAVERARLPKPIYQEVL